MAQQTREILTIQCGHYANFVGAHWWNLQQSSFHFDPNVSDEDNCVNHDILFREGKTLSGDFTFTPRLIAFEQKESMGTLKKEGVLYDLLNSQDILWQSGVEIEQSKRIMPNQFLKDLAVEDGMSLEDDDSKADDVKESGECEVEEEKDMNCESYFVKKKIYDLDDCAKVWSDILKVHYHPRTICYVENHTSSDDENCSESVLIGRNYARKIADEIDDKVHFFSEECDHLQSFQLFIDPYDKFGGVSTHVLEMIADEYSSKSVLSIGFHPCEFVSTSSLTESHRALSSLIAYTMIHDHSSLFIPASCSQSVWPKTESVVNIPYLDYKSELNYHTSAILAGLLDTATLCLRSKINPIHVGDLCSSLNYSCRKIAALVGMLPLPLSYDKPLLDHLMNLQTLPWTSFSSLSDSCKTDPQIQHIVLRGVSGLLSKKSQYQDQPKILNLCQQPSDILELYMKESMPGTRSLVKSFNPPLNTAAPFPHIFDKKISAEGLVSTEDRLDHRGVESVPMLAGLQSHSQMGQHLKNLVQCVRSINIKRIGNFFDESFEVDDFNECLERMLTIIEDYPLDDETDSDSDNDDA